MARPICTAFISAALLALLQGRPAIALSATEIAQKARLAVVTISTYDGLGSGTIIDRDGSVLTCRHVYDGTRPARIKLSTGEQYPAGKILWSDPAQDIVVTGIKLRGTRSAPFLPIGDSSKLKPGEDIIAVGSPRGFDCTISKGNVSAVRRVGDCPPDFREFLLEHGRTDDDTLIQFTAPVSPGSSGGPLLNAEGEVVGVCIISNLSADNMYFAVPVNAARAYVARRPVAASFGGGGSGGGGGAASAGTAPEVFVLLALTALVAGSSGVLVVRRQASHAAPAAVILCPAERKGVAIGSAPVTIGRSSQCSLVLQSPGVSRTHAVIRRIRGDLVIDDLGSTLGTYVNGRRYKRQVLKNGDLIAVGSVVLVLRESRRTRSPNRARRRTFRRA